ncbi:uncharacterized protein LOC143151711 [Ptiloglossa arizonensis]|uniref:uncharacterized protein LOC143151711 n=1 Tax=Ptiloglossa arizonensis TaxID=3350558 RepID=UPI003FA0FEB2
MGMHRVQQTIRVALFAATLNAVLDVSFGDSRLPLMCKNIARDVIINSCKGPRIKRGVHISNQETLGKELQVDVSNLENDLRAIRQKRQWGTIPGMTGGSVNTYHNTELNTPLLNFDDNQQTDITSQQFGPSDGFMPYGPAMGPPMGPPMGLPMGPPMGPGMFERFRFAASMIENRT